MTFLGRPCAYRLRRLARSLRRDFFQILRRGIFPVNSCVKLLLWDVYVHSKFLRERALEEILLNSFLRGPCMILYRSLTEDLVEILVRSFLRGPCVRSLQIPCLRGACMKALVLGSWEVLVSRSGGIAPQQQQALLWRSCEILLPQDPFYKSLCEDLVETLVKCCQRPLDDLVQVLVRNSWKCPA